MSLRCWLGIHANVYDDAEHRHCARCPLRERATGRSYVELDICDTRRVAEWVDDPWPTSVLWSTNGETRPTHNPDGERL